MIPGHLVEAMSQRKKRVEHGHEFLWSEELGLWYSVKTKPEHHLVLVMELKEYGRRRGTWWAVFSPETGSFETLTGHSVEYRAFSIAIGLITQRN